MGVGAPDLLTPPDAGQAAQLRWRRRPLLRATIRVAAVVAPALAAIAVGIAFSHTIPPPVGLAGNVVWWAGFLAAFGAAWLITTDLVQRAMPLATLLDLALVFPNSVPSRLAIRRKADPRRLQAELNRLRSVADPDSSVRAQLILELAVALSIHDTKTRGHSERVRMYTDLVARELDLDRHDADRLRWAALLHDIGKLAVAPEVLNKPARPDEDELETLRNHPAEGYRLIAPLLPWLGVWAATVRDHHEHFDGTGYPQGLAGQSISLGGRIVAVTDSYETMTAGRPYRKALSIKDAREELVRRSGTHFDPDVVRAFLAISYARLWPVAGVAAMFAPLPFFGPVTTRLSQLGTKSVSGVAAAGAAFTLVAAGLAGPAPLLDYGPAGKPAIAGVVTAPNPITSSNPGTPAGTPPAASSSPARNPVTTASVTTTAPGSTAGIPTGGPSSGGGGKAAYPSGIGKHATLPRGIAKLANPFAQWRIRH